MKRFGLMAGVLTVGLLFSACSQAPAEVKGGLEPQFGSPRDDYANVITTDVARGRVYVAGAYTGPYDENGTTRGDVVFFQRYNRDGRFVWKVSANVEAPNAQVYAADADTDAVGNVYFGWTKQDYLQGEYALTSFVSKYSPAGTRLFRAELKDRTVTGLALDGTGNVYVAGRTYGAAKSSEFVRKYMSSGRLVWEKLLRGSDLLHVVGLDVAADGSVYLAGSTVLPDEGEVKPTLIKVRGDDGKLLWQTATGGYFYGRATEVAVSGTSVYAVTTHNDSDTSPQYIAKFRPDGSRVWLRRTASDRPVRDLSADAQGNAYLTGALLEYAPDELDDPFVLKYTPSGSLVFNKVFSDPTTNAKALGVGVASSSELYLVGSTDGTVNGKNNGSRDAFLMRLNGQGQKVWER